MDDDTRPYKLVYLKLTPRTVEASIATLPIDPDVDVKEISFRGPDPVADNNEFKFYVEDNIIIPVFDYQKGEIVWITHVVAAEKMKLPVFVRDFQPDKLCIWHIGSHSSLDFQIYFDRIPSPIPLGLLIIKGGSLHLNSTQPSNPSLSYEPLVIRRLLEDGKWKELLVITSPNIAIDNGREDRLLFGYEDKDPSINYIYLARFSSGNYGNRLHLSLMRTNLFRELNSTTPSMWQSFQIPCTPDKGAARPFGQLITTDVSTGKRRLYILGANMSSFRNVYTTWIPLRKDGDVDAKKGSTLPSNLGIIPIKSKNPQAVPRNLKITDLNHRRILLSWEEKGIPHGLFGRIRENGATPEADQWKGVVLKFEVPLDEADRQAFASLLVPDSFE